DPGLQAVGRDEHAPHALVLDRAHWSSSSTAGAPAAARRSGAARWPATHTTRSPWATTGPAARSRAGTPAAARTRPTPLPAPARLTADAARARKPVAGPW